MMLQAPPPLGLYIHLPWCERKCPYCDFNSHEAKGIPEAEYVKALLADVEQELPLVWGRSIESIFIGGGTPSLFSATAIDELLCGLRGLFNLRPGIEITMESNPGSAEAERYQGYHEAGVNRLSIGVQSFNDEHLSQLGRVHDAQAAMRAFRLARDAGFDNINLDLMYGLPGQTVTEAKRDLNIAIDLAPEHLSHYQLTIEENTLFHHRPPAGMPDNDLGWELQHACQNLLSERGYRQYEISAYSRNRPCVHNLNYWHFGDYIGIGAGAHGKLSLPGEQQIRRRVRTKHPTAYLTKTGAQRIARDSVLEQPDLVFEFMLNTLRLTDGFDPVLFSQTTGLPVAYLQPTLEKAREKGLLNADDSKVQPTELGFRFLNDLQEMFLEVELPKNQVFFTSVGHFIHT